MTSRLEETKKRWKRHIVFEKGYTEAAAQWMAERIAALADHAVWTRIDSLPQTKWRIPVGESNTDLLRREFQEEIRCHPHTEYDGLLERRAAIVAHLLD